jgi:hypothetical protein
MTQVFEIDRMIPAVSARRSPPLNRDMDLVRRILIHVDKKETLRPEQIVFDDIADEVLGRHIEMLHKEGLLEGEPVDLSHLSYLRVDVTDLTWAGHDLVSALRNEGVWQQMKQKLTAFEMATVPLDMLKSLALALLEKYLKGKLGL